MKKSYKWVIGILGLAALALILNNSGGLTLTQNETSEIAGPQDQEAQQGAETEPGVLYVKAMDFIKEFEENFATAEEKYQGKVVEATTCTKEVSEDSEGRAYLALEPTSDDNYQGMLINCFYNDDPDPAAFEHDAQLTVRGTVDIKDGSVNFENCEVLSVMSEHNE